MKKKSGKTKKMLMMALMISFVMSFCAYYPAPEAGTLKKHQPSQQSSGDSGVSPAPMVDASPINPDSGGRKNANDTLKQRKGPVQPQKKVMPRRP